MRWVMKFDAATGDKLSQAISLTLSQAISYDHMYMHNIHMCIYTYIYIYIYIYIYVIICRSNISKIIRCIKVDGVTGNKLTSDFSRPEFYRLGV